MRVVQFGAGRIGKIHAGNIVAHPRSELVGIVDPVADAASALADCDGFGRWTRSASWGRG